MKRILLVCGLIIISANSRGSETVFGPSTIRVGTNEAILLTTFGGNDEPTLIVDGVEIDDIEIREGSPVFALAGPHDVVFTNSYQNQNFFVTFQRLTNSPIRTIMAVTPGTNFVEVPSGKTIQMFQSFSGFSFPSGIEVQPRSSTNWFECFSREYPHPSISGPVTVRVMLASGYLPTGCSYYITDEVVVNDNY